MNMALFIDGNMCNMWLYKSNRKCYKYGFVKGGNMCNMWLYKSNRKCYKYGFVKGGIQVTGSV